MLAGCSSADGRTGESVQSPSVCDRVAVGVGVGRDPGADTGAPVRPGFRPRRRVLEGPMVVRLASFAQRVPQRASPRAWLWRPTAPAPLLGWTASPGEPTAARSCVPCSPRGLWFTGHDGPWTKAQPTASVVAWMTFSTGTFCWTLVVLSLHLFSRPGQGGRGGGGGGAVDSGAAYRADMAEEP